MPLAMAAVFLRRIHFLLAPAASAAEGNLDFRFRARVFHGDAEQVEHAVEEKPKSAIPAHGISSAASGLGTLLPSVAIASTLVADIRNSIHLVIAERAIHVQVLNRIEVGVHHRGGRAGGGLRPTEDEGDEVNQEPNQKHEDLAG